MGGWMGGWVDGWKKSHFKDCLQHSQRVLQAKWQLYRQSGQNRVSITSLAVKWAIFLWFSILIYQGMK
jgi:hypothetical protein